MLISFSMENWRSFRDSASFSMVASRERANANWSARLPPMYGTTKVLPAAAIYGANASGKTSIPDALSFMQGLVVRGVSVNQMTGADPFRLDAKHRHKPCKFTIEVLVDNLIYAYKISLTQAEILEESLHIKRTKSNQMIFERDQDTIRFGKKYDSSRHRLIAQNTRANQLFLHNAVSQNSEAFSPLYNWFKDSLQIIGVDATFENHSSMLLRSDYQEFLNCKLRRYCTGAQEISLAPVALDSIVPAQDIVRDFAGSLMPDDERRLQVRINGPRGCDIYIVQMGDGGPEAYRVRLGHHTTDGPMISFDLADESKGTQRLIELLPMFFDLAEDGSKDGPSERVYIVDEIDRSFHSAMTIDLIHGFLQECSPESRRQLIFTTHDLMLMSSKLMRRDETWFCEKDTDGASSLKCLGTHKGVRTDTDLLSSYTKGIYGGYPTFGE